MPFSGRIAMASGLHNVVRTNDNTLRWMNAINEVRAEVTCCIHTSPFFAQKPKLQCKKIFRQNVQSAKCIPPPTHTHTHTLDHWEETNQIQVGGWCCQVIKWEDVCGLIMLGSKVYFGLQWDTVDQTHLIWCSSRPLPVAPRQQDAPCWPPNWIPRC